MAASLGSRAPSKRHKWSFASSQRRTERVTELASPPGFSSSLGQGHSEASRETEANLIVKKSWDVALAPWKQVPMNLFIMYMAGNSISIFPIMMVGMLFLRPVKALLTIQSTFKMIEGGQAILQKIVYLFGNLACLALALYKCSSMGLLPTHASDWLDFVEPLQRIEHSGGGIILSWTNEPGHEADRSCKQSAHARTECLFCTVHLSCVHVLQQYASHILCTYISTFAALLQHFLQLM